MVRRKMIKELSLSNYQDQFLHTQNIRSNYSKHIITVYRWSLHIIVLLLSLNANYVFLFLLTKNMFTSLQFI